MAARLLFAGVLGAALLLVLALLLGPRWRRAKLSRIRATAPPPQWDEVLRVRMSYYRAMTPAVRERLLAQMQVFLHEKQFVGCAGLTVTDEMRIVVAAWASLMTLGTEIPYPALRQILIYPDAFLVDKEYEDDSGVVTMGRDALIGESWEEGKVILSWADIESELGARGNATNVIVHEFAHQLDAMDGDMAGSPPLQDARAQKAWADIFAEEYDKLRAAHEIGTGRLGVLDPYGATEPAEFFAVVAEAFFQTPVEFHRDHGELYAVLTRYFAVDPRAWLPHS